jgi:hypothetical protein
VKFEEMGQLAQRVRRLARAAMPGHFKRSGQLQGFERFGQSNPVRNIPRHDHLCRVLHPGQIGVLGVPYGLCYFVIVGCFPMTTSPPRSRLPARRGFLFSTTHMMRPPREGWQGARQYPLPTNTIFRPILPVGEVGPPQGRDKLRFGYDYQSLRAVP